MHAVDKKLIERHGFSEVTDNTELTEKLVEERDALAARIHDMGGLMGMHAYSDLTDALVLRVFELAMNEAAKEDPTSCDFAAHELAIVAVGGYGRREMCPFSDVDITFVSAQESEKNVDVVVKRAFRILMDVCESSGLKVGYSFRTPDELDDLPLETVTALLDSRLIAGSYTVFDAFRASLLKSVVPASFVNTHIKERLFKGTGDITPYIVNPDVKTSCGGLRDLHAARWITRVAFGIEGDDIWHRLRSLGLILDSELSEIVDAIEFLGRVRNALHVTSGRPNDVLSVNRMEEIADWLGYSGPEELEKLYYSHAHRVHLILRKMADASLSCELEIEPGITAKDKRLYIRDKGILTRDNSAIIRIFYHAQAYGLSLSRDASDAVTTTANTVGISTKAHTTFLDILSSPGVGGALQSMADHGVLQAIVPRFSELMALVPGDSVHKYTVGEHSLRTVKELERLFSSDNDILQDVLSRVQGMEILFLSALLHDMGKLDNSANHARSGSHAAARFARSLGLNEESCKKIEFLVRNHLRMSETARLRDLSKRKTIRDFVSVVKDRELLDMLLLLTIADSQAVGTRHWNKVQHRFLYELHERASAAIRMPQSSEVDIERHRKRVRRELGFANLPDDEIDEHCTSLPASYLLNTSPEELALHIGFVRQVRTGSSGVDIRDDRAGEFTQLTVVAEDKPALLSKVAGVLYALGIDIHSAQIYTRKSSDQIAIDILYVDFEGRQLSEMKKWQLEGELCAVLDGDETLSTLFARMGKSDMTEADTVEIREHVSISEEETVLEVRAEDSPGFLHYVTGKLSDLGWQIHSARVVTWGHSIRDVFYLTDKKGSRLSASDIDNLSNELTKPADQ